MKKMVVKLPIEDEKAKRKAFKLVAGVEGVESVAVDVKENKITVVGDADPVHLTAKLRKLGHTELVSVGPAKEEKKEEKKPQADAKKDQKPPQVMYVSYDYPPLPHHYYSVPSEESPSGCTIL